MFGVCVATDAVGLLCGRFFFIQHPEPSAKQSTCRVGLVPTPGRIVRLSKGRRFPSTSKQPSSSASSLSGNISSSVAPAICHGAACSCRCIRCFRLSASRRVAASSWQHGCAAWGIHPFAGAARMRRLRCAHLDGWRFPK